MRGRCPPLFQRNLAASGALTALAAASTPTEPDDRQPE